MRCKYMGGGGVTHLCVGWGYSLPVYLSFGAAYCSRLPRVLWLLALLLFQWFDQPRAPPLNHFCSLQKVLAQRFCHLVQTLILWVSWPHINSSCCPWCLGNSTWKLVYKQWVAQHIGFKFYQNRITVTYFTFSVLSPCGLGDPSV